MSPAYFQILKRITPNHRTHIPYAATYATMRCPLWARHLWHVTYRDDE